MKKITLLLILALSQLTFSQVGINTTTPDASSMLDISSTDKGVLVPRVSLTNVTTTMLDGTNTAATGLLIWNTNASTTGGNGVGFYFFNGTQWMPITQSGSSDEDWHISGTSNSPTAITDNIVTQGNVTVGNSVSGGSAKLNVLSNTANSTSLKIDNSGVIGLENQGIQITNNSLTGTSSERYIGVLTNLSSSNGFSQTGFKADFDNMSENGFYYGLNNDFQAGGTNGYQRGLRNYFGGGQYGYGVDNVFPGAFTYSVATYGVNNNMSSEGNGAKYGTFNSISGSGTGAKYGTYTSIGSASGGTHYGIYSDVLKTGSYAGYFLGQLSIGTTTSNNYILPTSRGANGQIMQTDGTGNVSWTNPTTGTDDQNLTAPTLTGTTLNLGIESGTGTSIDLAPLQDGTGTDDQIIDNFSLSGTTLRLSLENDGLPLQTVNLSSLQDGTGTDDQNLTTPTLTGTTLNLGIENGTGTSIDLNALSGDDDWTDVGADIERQTGNVYVGDTNATNNKLIISGIIEDWDNNAFSLDPSADSFVNEINYSAGSQTDPSIHFDLDTNTGFFRPEVDGIGFTANGLEKIRFSPKGQIEVFNTGGSVYVGGNSGNSDDGTTNQNVGIGENALRNTSSGSFNVGIGQSALQNNTLGNRNVGVGYFALGATTSGEFNVGIGSNSLTSNTTGERNVGIGNSTLSSNIVGDFNVAIGSNALPAVTSSYNIGIGYSSGQFLVSGVRNIGIGYRAQAAHASGNDNVIIGDRAMDSNISATNASSNIAIGNGTITNLSEGSNNTVIGHNAFSLNDGINPNIANNNTIIGYNAGRLAEGDGNIFLGSNAGETAGIISNSLIIDNTNANADNALLYGEFGSDNTSTGNILRTNGQLQIGNPTLTGYAFPTTDGTANQILTTDGAGNASWSNSASNFALTKVNLSTTQNIASFTTKISFNTVDFDLNSNFNTTTRRFVVTENGYYRVNANVTSVNTIADDFQPFLFIRVNGVTRGRATHRSSISSGVTYRQLVNLRVDTVISLSVGDYIEVFLDPDSPSFQIAADPLLNTFEVERIR